MEKLEYASIHECGKVKPFEDPIIEFSIQDTIVQKLGNSNLLLENMNNCSNNFM